MIVVVASPRGSSRLVVVGRAAVILAVLAASEVPASVWRAANFPFGNADEGMSWPQRALTGGPSFPAVITGLIAVLLMFSLPRAPWTAKVRATVSLCVSFVCVANVFLTSGFVWLLTTPNRIRVFPSTIGAAVLSAFPDWALSIVLLVILADANGRTFAQGARLHVSDLAAEDTDSIDVRDYLAE